MARINTSTHAEVDDPFVHEALFYEGPRDYLDYTLRFIYDGLAADEPIMVAAPPTNLTLLKERLGALAGDVRFHDMTAVGRNPARIIPWVLSNFVEEHRDRRVRIIGESIWAGRSGAEYHAAVQHEAMINPAFTGRATTILCPYDVSRLDQQAIADAKVTHPLVTAGGQPVSSDEYDPYGVTARYNLPMPEPPAGATTMRLEVDNLASMRRVASEQGQRAGLSADRIDELLMAVNEVATNSLRFGGGGGTLRTWREPDRVVCEIRDFGELPDPMVGRLRPRTPDATGFGLALVHYLCDLVQTYTTITGTTVRMHVLSCGALPDRRRGMAGWHA